MLMTLLGREYFDFQDTAGKQVKAVRLYLQFEKPGAQYDGILVSDLYVPDSRLEFYQKCLGMELGGVYEPVLSFNPQKNTSYIIGFNKSAPIDISAQEILDSFEEPVKKK